MDELRKAMTDTPTWDTPTGRWNRRGPELQNIPVPRTKVGNYLIQMRAAEVMMRMHWQRLLDEGYIETAPGVLQHPVTKVMVER